MATEKWITEWHTLQNQYDSYEKLSLVIKLTAVALTTLAFLSSLPTLLGMALVALLWLQDSIWKTFQHRFEVRLLEVESAIKDGSVALYCQFNSRYQASANSGVALLAEYAKQALRPTVMFPYLPLIVLMALSSRL